MKTVQHYSVYFMGRDGLIQRRMDFVSPDDDYARQLAKRMVEDLSIELWQRARKVGSFKPSADVAVETPDAGLASRSPSIMLSEIPSLLKRCLS